MDESGHKREFMWGIENDYDTEDDDYCYYDSDEDDDDDTVLAEKLAKYLETRYSKVNQLSSSERKSTNLKETDVNEVVHNCEVKQSIAYDKGGADVSNTVVAEKQIEEDASHYSKDNSSSSKERKLTDLQETDVDDVVHNSEIRQSIANDEDGGDSVNNSMLEEKQIEEDQSHYSEDKKSDSDKSEFTYLQKTDMDEVVEKLRQRISNEDGYDINNTVIGEKQLEDDPSHYSEDNKSCSKESKFTNLQETDVNEMVYNCEVKQSIANDKGGDDISNTVVVEKQIEEDPSHYSKDNCSSSKERKLIDLQETDMVQNCEIRQSIANDDGDDTVNNAVLEENQIEEDQSHYSEDKKSDSENSEFTCLQKTDMDEVVEKHRQRIANEGDDHINNVVLAEKQLEKDPSHYSEGNKSCSKQSKFTNLQETDMNEMVYNCEVKQSIANDKGGDDISNTVVVEKQIEEDSSHYSKDICSSSKERKLTDLQETDVVQNSEIRQSIANDDSGDSANTAVLEEKQIEKDQSPYSEDKKSDSEKSEFTYLQKTDAESTNNCSCNVLGNSEVSAKHDAHVEDETAVRNFQNLRDMDMDNGLNVEHILSCLKSLQCPFVWKPDKEVEMHPRGEIPINLAQHLTEKERGFIRMETDLFREVTIYLVLAYHKCITMLPKEGLLDIQHCYDILLKAEKEILNVSVVQADEDSRRKDTNISNVLTSMEETQNLPLANCGVSAVSSNCGKSSRDDQDDCEDMMKTEMICTSSMTTSGDNSRCINHRKAVMEFPLKNDVEDKELFAKLFDMKTHCEWTDTNTAQRNVFENWKTESNNDNESCSSSTKLPADKSERRLETQSCNHSKTQKEIDKELQKLHALQCVTAASLAHVAFSFGYGQDVMKIIEYIEKLSKSLNSTGEAVVLALRGAVLCEYGYVGNKLALPWIKEALRLDPDNWEWNLYCAKIIGRLRRNEKTCNTEPYAEEIEMLRKAVELNPTNPSCLVHLANTYRSVAGAHYRQRIAAQAGSACDDPLLNSRLQRNWRSSRSSWHQDEVWKQMPITSKDNKEYLSMAKELYLEALKYGRNCPYTNARCAKGLWSMPNPYKDKKIAQETILHALCLAPDDSLVNHHAGMFYEYCHDYEKALSCYEIATQNGKFNYPAEMNYINLRLKIAAPGSYSPIFRLHGLLHKYNGVNHMVQTLCLRGYYHYEIEKILLLAIQNFAMAIELKPASPILVDFYPGQMLKNYPESINIYDLLEQILQDFEEHPEHDANIDIVKYATDILKMGNKMRNECCDFSKEY
ncbi:uncharacterized protein LOC126272343 isoform X2 [Schistocerca gregaria]|uniref:uncharacterized protein LOC126272343 isoform X2 n=1 Tax=Schistocerca gregaria TaxID=7010 RepID=UPI00211E693C|nr:uncharacterized protein LOC126272343 isoform X2 [Schistocerca gregaria]XP_049831098.1 uncharacterized protein LOC126272343 isoform X2 [Schistocerca gregaria]